MGSHCGCESDPSTNNPTMQTRSNKLLSLLNLHDMEILDFETRIKKFAHPEAKGQLSIEQLTEAFKGTEIFAALRNPYSPLFKLVTSPLFLRLPLSHYHGHNEIIDIDIFARSETAYK